MLIMVDMEIVKEDRRVLPSETFQKRYEALKEAKEAARTKFTTYNSGAYNRNNASNSKIGFGAYADEADLWEDTPWGNKKSTQTQRKEFPKTSKDGKVKVSMSDKEFDKYLLIWLTEGLSAFEGLHFNVVPDDVEAALKVFDEYFDKETPAEHLEYFIMFMSRITPDVFDDVHPNLVAMKGCKSMDAWEGMYDICKELYNIFDSYVQYLQELKALTQ